MELEKMFLTYAHEKYIRILKENVMNISIFVFDQCTCVYQLIYIKVNKNSTSFFIYLFAYTYRFVEIAFFDILRHERWIKYVKHKLRFIETLTFDTFFFFILLSTSFCSNITSYDNR